MSAGQPAVATTTAAAVAAATASSIAQNSLWLSLLRAFLGELGDKTFFIIACFSAWCPWIGVRGGQDLAGVQHARIQRLFVFLGSFGALALRCVLNASVPNPRFWDMTLLYICSVLLALLSAKAYIDISRASNKQKSASGALKAADAGANDTASAEEVATTQWNSDAFRSSLPQESPSEGYGSMPVQSTVPTSADGVFSERPQDHTISCVFALLMSFALTFLAEVDDRSEDALLGAHHRGFGIAIGSIIAAVITVPLAVLLGVFVERQFSDEHICSGMTAAFGAMSLITLSQALLHLPVLENGSTARIAGSFLSIGAAVRGGAGVTKT